MNKRSAVLIAAGLVLTLGIGGLAVSLGLTGPSPVNAAGPVRPERVVKVERRTVTIHQKAKPASAGDHHSLGPRGRRCHWRRFRRWI